LLNRIGSGSADFTRVRGAGPCGLCGQKFQRLNVPGPGNRAVPMVEGGDLVHAEALSYRDHRGVSGAKRKIVRQDGPAQSAKCPQSARRSRGQRAGSRPRRGGCGACPGARQAREEARQRPALYPRRVRRRGGAAPHGSRSSSQSTAPPQQRQEPGGPLQCGSGPSGGTSCRTSPRACAPTAASRSPGWPGRRPPPRG